MATDLHPDIVRAIRGLANTQLGRRYDKMARKRYGLSGGQLAGKTSAAEFGGRSTKTGRGVVSSAGARGPAQFIPSTRQQYIEQYGYDPWAGDRSAMKGLMQHQLNTGVEGYNPGDPGYKDLVLSQRLNREDRVGLRGGESSQRAGSAASGTRMTPSQTRTIPGQSFEGERQGARRDLLLGGKLNMTKLLSYKQSVNSMQDVPDRKVTTPGSKIGKVPRGKTPSGKAARDSVPGKGNVAEVFYDPLGSYWDQGKVTKGAIGGHGGHVHVSADKSLVEELGRYAQGMGLKVSGQDKFGGRPTSGHTDGSFHYKGQGIDVSGDPKKMRSFAQTAMRRARHG